MSTVESTNIGTLFTLHTELLLEILHELDHWSLLKCAETCSTLRSMIEETTSLQCIIQMGALGLGASYNTLGPTDLMDCLRERRRRWDTLDWSSISTLRLTGSCKAYEFVGGVFAQSDGFNISFQWLPSSTSSGSRINHESFAPLRDFAMDPSQDLLIILEQNYIYDSSVNANTLVLHIRTMATQSPHEEAASPRLTFAIPPDNTPYGNGVVGAALYIMGDLLSINLQIGTWAESKCRILIFNWKTGKTLYDSDKSQLGHTLEGFEFLTKNIFLMISHDACGSLWLYSFDHRITGNETLHPKLLCTLSLPKLSSGSSLSASNTYHDACVGRSVPSDDQPFKSLLEESLLVLSLTYSSPPSHGDHGRHKYTFIVPIRVLLRYSKEMIMGDLLEATPVPKRYDWEDWGPQSTRFLHSCVPIGWLRFALGQKIVLSNSSGEPHAQPLQILDFSRRRTPRISTSETTIMHIGRDAPTSIVQPSPFEEDVVTYLPYSRLIRPSMEVCTLLMLDEHRILGITLEDVGQVPETRLHVYTF